MKLKTISLALSLAVASQSGALASSKAPSQDSHQAKNQMPSNVIIVVADQMRRHSMNFWKQDKFKNTITGKTDNVVTPNLDKLANQGVVFTDAIANYPLCSPFRGMLMSGLYPHNNGVTNNTRIGRPNVGLRTDITAITKAFANAGYNTALVGKGHWKKNLPLFNDKNEYVGTTEKPGGHYLQGTKFDTFIPAGPERHGIEYWYQSIGHNHDHPLVYTNDVKLTGQSENLPYYPKTYSAVDQANVIIDYLRNNRDQRDVSKPFTLLWTMDPPHSPYKDIEDTDVELYNKYYKDMPMAEVLNRPNVDTKRAEKFAKIHFSMVTLIDREFGRIMAELEKTGLDKNTLVVFTSDHGEMMGSHQKMAKNVFYEESLSIPLLIQYPGKIKAHTTDLLINVPDFMPTILGLVSLQDYIPANLDGEDFSEQLLNPESKNAKQPKSSLYYGKSSELGVRTHQYTYALNNQGKLIGLFDNKKDPYQLNMLSMADIPKADSQLLKQELGLWLKKINHPVYQQGKFPNMITYP